MFLKLTVAAFLNKTKFKTWLLCFRVLPPTDKPGPPAAFDITDITNESCLLTWNPPRDDGGSKVTNYVVERKATDSDVWHKLSSTVKDTNFKATKLTPNKEYIFRVAAENMYGVGEPVQAAPIVAKYQFGKIPHLPPDESKKDADGSLHLGAGYRGCDFTYRYPAYRSTGTSNSTRTFRHH